MTWNWQNPEWPRFVYNPEMIAEIEKKFLVGMGSAFAYLKTIDKEEYHYFLVEILSEEGLESAKIEGEVLDRASLQSSIQRHFGLEVASPKKGERESCMAALLHDVYETFDQPLTHEMLGRWHALLFGTKTGHLTDVGKYRSHPEPMRIVSNRYGATVIYYEAPPSKRVFKEMEAFINWFNATEKKGSILGRAAIAHLYFESIHPFEDGNGRIGRAIVEKVLSQSLGKPVLVAISRLLEKRKKEYYAELERSNRTLEVQGWVEFFASIVLKAHEESVDFLYFLIPKSKMLHTFSRKLNSRQMKALLRMFAEGPAGFTGGLSAENYISITKASRATATRDLAELVEKGALVKTGELRHTRYHLNLKR